MLHPGVREAFARAQETFRDLGAYVLSVDLPMMHAGVAAYYILAPAEASSNLARYDGVRYGRRADLAPHEGLLDLYERSRGEGFGTEVKRRIMLGTHVLSSGYSDKYYLTALRARRLIAQDFERTFSGLNQQPPCDVVLTPTTVSPAFKLGEKSADPLALYQEDVFTVGVNLAGLPAMSLPAGFSRASHHDATELPVGIQLIAPAFEEERLFRSGAMFQGATDWHTRVPPGCTPIPDDQR
jgi:aspartyl-tRNA(Asn)/glutamyl-tRNA(Gln) amidotransferase subunit A